MGRNNGNHGPRTRIWRSLCRTCGIHLAMSGHHDLWPDEIRCPTCHRWSKVVAMGTAPLAGDVICAPGSSRNRVQER